ncbi:MAG TPA: DUF4197 domain-containing protein [Flavobacteriales bacterium]|nr:DUF4197 domain-containing protein [Flavobacteriales bacterium]
MKKLFYLPFLFMLGPCTSTDILQAVNDVIQTPPALSESDIAAGLKEALVKGTGTGTATASKLDGYFKNPRLKIPFPPEITKVETKLRQLGMNSLVDDFILSLNRGAEKAATEAKPIFVDAIKSMTVKDAWGILRGEDDAATDYLRRTTSNSLEAAFKPVIKTSLDAVDATKYFTKIVNTYNKIPLIEKVNPNLEDYATDKAMFGLFLLIEDEERKIRKDPVARTTELLKKVFSQQ